MSVHDVVWFCHFPSFVAFVVAMFLGMYTTMAEKSESGSKWCKYFRMWGGVSMGLLATIAIVNSPVSFETLRVPALAAVAMYFVVGFLRNRESGIDLRSGYHSIWIMSMAVIVLNLRPLFGVEYDDTVAMAFCRYGVPGVAVLMYWRELRKRLQWYEGVRSKNESTKLLIESAISTTVCTWLAVSLTPLPLDVLLISGVVLIAYVGSVLRAKQTRMFHPAMQLLSLLVAGAWVCCFSMLLAMMQVPY